MMPSAGGSTYSQKTNVKSTKFIFAPQSSKFTKNSIKL